jgi:CBS domain-containing protein
MRIEQLMTRPTKTCRPDQTLREAAQMMWENDYGCLPVTAEDGSQRLLGIITDRDICMVMRFQGAAPNELRVADAMAKEAYACNPDDPVAEAKMIMREIRVRRLPVVDDSERVIGMISLAGLAREAVRQASSRNPEVTEAEIGSLLAAICEPREHVRDSTPT